ncbi:MAG: hypothetical protein IKS92_10335 [Victivallales bacterium]|nr:hypothetical protein [Victivallales bacterium]MBR4371434.1 hypothetical protein [Victivallales bacterium]
MKFTRWQTIILLLAVALLVFGQQPRLGHDEASVWRQQAEVAAFTPLRHLDFSWDQTPLKLRLPAVRFQETCHSYHATYKPEIAFSNTSFMACRHCVCIPLRL